MKEGYIFGSDYDEKLTEKGYSNIFERNLDIWLYLKKKENFLYKYIQTEGMPVKDLVNHFGFPTPSKPLVHHIEEVYPIGYTDKGEIICIPNYDICPTIGIFGRKRTGKCVDEDTEIWVNNTIKKLKDVEIGDEVV